MSSANFGIDLSRFRRKLEDCRERLPRLVQIGLTEAAQKALEQRYGKDLKAAAKDESGSMYARLGGNGARLVPVTLKHQRREQWPDVEGLYFGKVPFITSRGVKVRRAWVDAVKLQALKQKLLKKRLSGALASGDWRFNVVVSGGAVSIRIFKEKATPADAEAAKALTLLTQEIFDEQANAILYRALA